MDDLIFCIKRARDGTRSVAASYKCSKIKEESMSARLVALLVVPSQYCNFDKLSI